MKHLTLLTTLCVAATLGVGCDRNRANEPVEETREGARGEGAQESPAATRLGADAGANAGDGDSWNSPNPRPGEAQAEVELEAADGAEIDGEAEFYETGSGVRIVATVNDAPPGKHGIHIHEKGDCSNIAGKSMGGHFAPEGDQHALPSESGEKHLGDLGNIEVDENGKGRMEITVAKANLKPNDKMSFLGKALVVHASEDAGKSKQPSGDSGKPMACGVVEKT